MNHLKSIFTEGENNIHLLPLSALSLEKKPEKKKDFGVGLPFDLFEII